MGQKDLAAKQFECRPEVFADIINALIFEGEQVVFREICSRRQQSRCIYHQIRK